MSYPEFANIKRTFLLNHQKRKKKETNWFNAILCIDHTTQKMKFSIKDFFSKCDQIRRTVSCVYTLFPSKTKETYYKLKREKQIIVLRDTATW